MGRKLDWLFFFCCDTQAGPPVPWHISDFPDLVHMACQKKHMQIFRCHCFLMATNLGAISFYLNIHSSSLKVIRSNNCHHQ